MTPIFENATTATTIYPLEQTTTVQHEGRRYRLVGESLGNDLSLKQRFVHVIMLVGYAVAIFFTGGLSKVFLNAFNCHLRELQAGRHINLHYSIEKPSQWQVDSINPFVKMLQTRINHNEYVPEFLTTASCCISIQYNHGDLDPDKILFENHARVKRQFIFKNEDGSPISKKGLIQDIEGIEEELLSSINTEVDVATTRLSFGCVLLHQDSADNLVNASYDSIISEKSNQSIPGSSINNAIVDRVLRFVCVNPRDVISPDGKQILEGPDCM
ncbi:MAG: hypothetical protein H0T62_06200 [Parachlamydiaceae bacterium]|nr:hypothetical protein [Parachlamydiaceae bacterium]